MDEADKKETEVERYRRMLPAMMDTLIEAAKRVQEQRAAELERVLRSGVLNKGD